MSNEIKKGDSLTVSLETLYRARSHELGLEIGTDLGFTIDNTEPGYFDLKDKYGITVCMDGETCTVTSVATDGSVSFENTDGEFTTEFKLSADECGHACFGIPK